MIAASTWFLDNAWLIPVIPGVAFAAIILIGKRLPMGGSELGIASMAAALVLAAGTGWQWIQRTNDAGEAFVEPVVRKWVWWQSGGVEFSIGQHVDGLAAMALFLVAFISLLVQIYSIEYVRGDRRYTHFFAIITLFSAGMLTMVCAENMVQLILGWEIMGLCSMLLIGHWWEDEANARAGLKAFFTLRVSDVGLLVGTAILYFGAGSFNIREISTWALSGDPSHGVIFWAAVFLFIASIGKSGQFPLHTWLPDAMAGPTPVSSLLHSSTMVVAGVFLVARLYPVFWEGFSIPDVDVNLIVVIAGITILISGLLGLVQDDIKKVLAYSTVGQLAYMMLGLGAGAWLPAVFHIFTHAFFKCCLFLCAGSVSHSGSHHSFDMKRDMGGLWRKMPVTFAAWSVSSLALVGVFPFAGFFSKDEIIDNVGHNGYSVFMWIALIGAFLTAAYTVRATYLTFLGEPRGAAAGVEHDVHAAHTGDAHDVDSEPALEHEDELVHTGPHESGKLLLVPVVILAAFAFGAGWTNPAMAGEEWHNFDKYVAPNVHEEEEHATESDSSTASSGEGERAGVTEFPALDHAEFHWFPNATTSLLIVGAGIVSAFGFCYAYYGRKDRRLVGLTDRVAPARWAYTFVANKYYLDKLYEGVVVRAIAHPIARAMYWVNQNVIDGIVDAAGMAGRRAGAWTYRWIDQGVVDGAVNGSGILTEEGGEALRPIQSGRVNNYGALLFGAAAVGAIVLVIINV